VTVPCAIPTLPEDLPYVIPDLHVLPHLPDPSRLLFFDLETTGLSTGSGTIAFLAAFGRYTPGTSAASSPPAGLQVTQYLLLDYPGEPLFLDAVLEHFAGDPVVVTYNGKTFDGPLLRTRCLMNGVQPPVYAHADLLHPCRRLWKRLLPSCTQAAIESHVLGTSRDGDLPGSEAPEAWFSFLKTGAADRLIQICDHNLLDIQGLAGIFTALCRLASAPIETLQTTPYDLESLALHRRRQDKLTGAPPSATTRTLLRHAVTAGSAHRAAAAEGGTPATTVAYKAATALAIDLEWQEKNYPAALDIVRSALSRNPPEPFLTALLSRDQRLLAKIARKPSPEY
jgi:hypothetical protein